MNLLRDQDHRLVEIGLGTEEGLPCRASLIPLLICREILGHSQSPAATSAG